MIHDQVFIPATYSARRAKVCTRPLSAPHYLTTRALLARRVITHDPIITFGSDSRAMLLFSATLLLRLFGWGFVLRRFGLQRPQIVLQAV